MSFSELESLRNLTNIVYDNLISEANDNDSAESYKEEKENYLTVLDDIIEQRVVQFLD